MAGMISKSRGEHLVLDQFMSARSELIKLVNAGKVGLKLRAGKLADLQETLKCARQRVIQVYKIVNAMHKTKYRAMTARFLILCALPRLRLVANVSVRSLKH